MYKFLKGSVRTHLISLNNNDVKTCHIKVLNTYKNIIPRSTNLNITFRKLINVQ